MSISISADTIKAFFDYASNTPLTKLCFTAGVALVATAIIGRIAFLVNITPIRSFLLAVFGVFLMLLPLPMWLLEKKPLPPIPSIPEDIESLELNTSHVVDSSSKTTAPIVPDVVDSIQSPKQAVVYYFDVLLNQRKYEDGWLKLTDQFKQRKKINYDIYTSYWNTIEHIVIANVDFIGGDAEELAIIQKKETTARLRADITFLPVKTTPDSYYIEMVWDSSRKEWLINRTDKQKVVVPPPPVLVQ